MEITEESIPPSSLLTGGNDQELLAGQSLATQAGNRCRTGGPRPPPRDEPESSVQPEDTGGSDDPLTLGFEKIMSRFDKLEFQLESTDRRVDNLEGPMMPDPDPPYYSEDAELEGYRDRHDFSAVDGAVPRFFNHGQCARGGDLRQRRGMQRDRNRREGRRPYQSALPIPRRDRRNPTQRTNWDRPNGRYLPDLDRGFHGYRQPTSWDSPLNRLTYQPGRGERPKDLNMKAPRFDGSEASNWISRVEYYFDHLQMPDSDRLHYVVMIFQPPAAEWIFNYRDNNLYVTWPEFLEDVRHSFDPQSFRNSIGPLSKLVQTGSVAEYHDPFERYLNRVQGLSEEALIPIFITGLKEPIQEKVELQQPVSLAEAMALALRLAASHEERHPQPNRSKWGGRESRYPAATQSKLVVSPVFLPRIPLSPALNQFEFQTRRRLTVHGKGYAITARRNGYLGMFASRKCYHISARKMTTNLIILNLTRRMMQLSGPICHTSTPRQVAAQHGRSMFLAQSGRPRSASSLIRVVPMISFTPEWRSNCSWP